MYFAYRASGDLFGAAVRAPGAILGLVVLYFQLMFVLLIWTAQILIWVFLALDWTGRKTSLKYCHFRKTHQLPSEKDPEGRHVL